MTSYLAAKAEALLTSLPPVPPLSELSPPLGVTDAPSDTTATPPQEVPLRARAVVTAPAPKGLQLQAPGRTSMRDVAARALASTLEIETTSEGKAAVGSAVVIEPGYALTSDHVVPGNDPIYYGIRVNGRLRTGTARVVGHAPGLDLALLELSDKTIPVATLRREPMRIGDQLMVAGTPLGLQAAATFGYVTGLHRDGGYFACDCVQTDAPINVGNSGGGTFDTTGALSGIASGYFEGAQSLGFVIPSTELPSVISRLHRGNINAPKSGLTFQPPSIRALAAANNGEFTGTVIGKVDPGSVAARAGVKSGEVLETINGKEINSVAEARLAMELVQKGSKVVLGIRRGAARQAVTLAF